MYLFLLIFFLFGVLIGSFLNALVWRIFVGKKIFFDRSMCPKCKHKLVWYDNIPLFSFLFLKGRCRYCREKISWQYPLLELASGVLTAFVFYFYNSRSIVFPLEMWRDIVIIWFLLFIFVYDLRYQLITDFSVLLPAGVLFFFNLYFAWLTWQSMLFGLIFGAGFFALQYIISKGAWIGGGDVRLAVFMAVILGFSNTLFALFLAYIIGAIVGVILIVNKKKKKMDAVPFGTFLTLATFVAMFWGDMIVNWYLSLIR